MQIPTLLVYFKESAQELGKVTWPNRRESIRLTTAVLVLSAVLGAYITLLDFGFVQILEQLILGV